MNKLLKTIYKSGLIRLSFAIGLMIFSLGSVQAQSDADLSGIYQLPTERLLDDEAARQVVQSKIISLKEQVTTQNLQYGTAAYRNVDMRLFMYDNILTGIAGSIDTNGNVSYGSVYKAIVFGLQMTDENFQGGVSMQDLQTLRADAINTLKQ